MPVFDRFRLVLKFRHRPFRIFWNFEKIFTELGARAPQSWSHFGKFGKFWIFRQLFHENHHKSVLDCPRRGPLCTKIWRHENTVNFFLPRDIGAQGSDELHIWYLWSYVQANLWKFLFFQNFDFRWAQKYYKIRFRTIPKNESGGISLILAVISMSLWF